MAKWVRHMSQTGKTYRVNEAYASLTAWCVYAKDHENEFYHYFPKDEYPECPAPEEWEDVTHEYVVISCGDHISHLGQVVLHDRGYRIRKVRLADSITGITRDAFIVERKKA